MAATQQVLIVGGGPAGLCAAIALTKRGIDVEVVEINDQIRPVGSGLSLNGISLRAPKMADEEALDRCVREGAGHPALTLRTGDPDADPGGLSAVTMTTMAAPF